MGVFISPLHSNLLSAQTADPIVTPGKFTPTPDNETEENTESLFPNVSGNLSASHFTWGAETGMSVDVSGYDSSTFNVDAIIGYKNSMFRILGAGVGMHRALGSGDTYIPVYALMRTSFSKRPRLLFLSLKAGYSFNTIGDAPTFGDVNAAIGMGINLAVRRNFQTHIILSYEFRHFNQRHRSSIQLDAEDISLASLTFGVNF